MNKILAVAIGAMVLAGCDDKFQLDKLGPPSDRLSISQMIATGKEEMAADCKKGSESLDCEFLGGDLAGSGKWHYSKIFIHKNGSVDLEIDGSAYTQVDAGASTYSGERYTDYEMRGINGNKATVSIVTSNDGRSLRFKATNAQDVDFVMGSVSI